MSVRAAFIQPVTVAEIDRALFDIDVFKSPSVNGFSAVFLKKSWPIIQQDVYNGVMELFQKSYLHKPINKTMITLVPEISQVLLVKDFGPIA